MAEEDYYEYLNIDYKASISEIKKAYRRKALMLHPDKNLENPKAKKDFEFLSQILDTLTDPVAKGEYDRLLKAKKERKIRDSELDSKRKKFKDILEEKERKAKEDNDKNFMKNVNRKREIERIRQINIQLVEEENDKLKSKAERQINSLLLNNQKAKFKLKVKWNSNSIMHSNFSLTNLFSKYGQVLEVVISKKSNSALIEFDRKESLLYAAASKPDHLEIEAIQVDIVQNSTSNVGHQNANNPYGMRIGQSLADFENEVLEKLRSTQQFRY